MTNDQALPDFDDRALAASVEMLTGEQRDRLPFGAIRLDRDNLVQVYNATERRQSGSGERERLGLDFFARIAPCMDNPDFRGRIERARLAGTLDLAFTHVGDFEDRDRVLSVRIQSAVEEPGYWVFIQRD